MHWGGQPSVPPRGAFTSKVPAHHTFARSCRFIVDTIRDSCGSSPHPRSRCYDKLSTSSRRTWTNTTSCFQLLPSNGSFNTLETSQHALRAQFPTSRASPQLVTSRPRRSSQVSRQLLLRYAEAYRRPWNSVVRPDYTQPGLAFTSSSLKKKRSV